MQKTIIGFSRAPALQPAGQAYQEHVFFGCQGMGRQANPVIRLGWTPPVQHAPHTPPSATGVQAQAGFDCVTLLLQGQLQTRDSAGQTHTLNPGDALWASAGQGVLQQQCHGPELARNGGTLELVTLWVNLPAAYKLTPAHSQLLPQADIPLIPLPDEAGHLRLIAGEWAGQLGPAETAAPFQLWDVQLHAGRSAALTLPRGWYGVLLTLSGAMRLNHWPHTLPGGHIALLDGAGDGLHLAAEQDTRLILASGEPLNETIASHEALVMNTEEQLAERQQALAQGQFGQLD